MEPPIPMLLPKGIVVNSRDIYKEVASYPVVPPEKICEYWHVYTTTFRKLIDPTAHRLENFWWHVWGSDRRYLSGEALAKLYEEISTGPTVVPIRGPPNHWEGPSFPRAVPDDYFDDTPESNASSSEVRDGAAPGITQNPVNPPLKILSSSSTKPPPPHPILKKYRGPSTSGPRPTARFISPHESADEGEKESDETSSSSTTNGGLELKIHHAQLSSSSSRADKKKATTPTKKFVVSTAKRRPVIARRLSSQSSTGSETGSREGLPPSGLRHDTSPRFGPTVELPDEQVDTTQRLDSHAADTQEPRLSAKAAGKRPAVLRPPVEKRASMTDAPMRGPAQHYLQTIGRVPYTRSLENVHEQVREFEARRRAGEVRGVATAQAQFTSPLRSAAAPPRSPATLDRSRHPEIGTGRVPRAGLVSEATAKTTSVAAVGTIIDFDPPPVSPLPAEDVEDDRLEYGGLPRQSSSASLLDSRFVPTRPSNVPPVPLGRTKSQLTLLLEREKARMGDKSGAK